MPAAHDRVQRRLGFAVSAVTAEHSAVGRAGQHHVHPRRDVTFGTDHRQAADQPLHGPQQHLHLHLGARTRLRQITDNARCREQEQQRRGLRILDVNRLRPKAFALLVADPLDQCVDVRVGRHVGRDHPQGAAVPGVVAIQRAVEPSRSPSSLDVVAMTVAPPSSSRATTDAAIESFEAPVTTAISLLYGPASGFSAPAAIRPSSDASIGPPAASTLPSPRVALVPSRRHDPRPRTYPTDAPSGRRIDVALVGRARAPPRSARGRWASGHRSGASSHRTTARPAVASPSPARRSPGR